MNFNEIELIYNVFYLKFTSKLMHDINRQRNKDNADKKIIASIRLN
jgi:hypothetical protein